MVYTALLNWIGLSNYFPNMFCVGFLEYTIREK